MVSGIDYQPVKQQEIAVGKPLPWAVYDADRKLLLARHFVIDSQSQLDGLLERGMFRVVHHGARTVDERAQRSEGEERICRLGDIRLRIGDTMQLQSRAVGDDTRYVVKLVGVMSDNAVIVNTPIINRSVAAVRQGASFVVRLFAGKSVYAFPTTVTRIGTSPFPHLFLEYPREVRGLEVRRSARVSVNIIAALRTEDGRQQACVVRNLSVGGALLQARHPLGEPGTRLQLKLRVTVTDLEQYLNLPTIIRVVHDGAPRDNAMPVTEHGVQFVGIAPNDQIALTSFVYQTLFEQEAN